MTYVPPPVGNLIMSEFYGVPAKKLDGEVVKDALLAALATEDFGIEAVVDVYFGAPAGSGVHETGGEQTLDGINDTEGINEAEGMPAGYTIAAVLAESHASIHTYPEKQSLVFVLYSCRGLMDGRRTLFELVEALEPASWRAAEQKVWAVAPPRQELTPAVAAAYACPRG